MTGAPFRLGLKLPSLPDSEGGWGRVAILNQNELPGILWSVGADPCICAMLHLRAPRRRRSRHDTKSPAAIHSGAKKARSPAAWRK